MPKFIFAYQQPAGYVTRTDADITAQWVGFFDTIGDSIVDPGQPVFERTVIGEVAIVSHNQSILYSRISISAQGALVARDSFDGGARFVDIGNRYGAANA